MSSKQIAEKCHVSASTIYRLCDKLGIDGLSEMKVAVTASLDDYRKTSGTFNYDFPVHSNQTVPELVEAMNEDYEQTILKVSAQVSYETLRGITDLIRKKKVIDIYTSAGNIFFAQNFSFQMQEIGYHVNVPVDEYMQRLTASSADDTHMAIYISFGGRGLINSILPDILRKKKTPVVLISSREYAEEFEGAAYNLYMNSEENHYNKISSFSTRLSVLYLLDLIYICYFEKDYEHLIRKKLEYYEYLTNRHE